MSPTDEASQDFKRDNMVSVQIGKDKYHTKIAAGAHQMTADEPKSVGGQDLGPGPYEFVLSGLGACTVMTLRMYADRKKWPLDKVTLHLEMKKETDATMITRHLLVEGDLDDEQRSRLVEIADKCPVHKTLEGDIKIQTVLES